MQVNVCNECVKKLLMRAGENADKNKWCLCGALLVIQIANDTAEAASNP